MSIALHVEGQSDFEFLEPLLRRLAIGHAPPGTVLAPIFRIGRREKSDDALLAKIREAAEQSAVDVVCLHQDADSRSRYDAVMAGKLALCEKARAKAGSRFGCVPIVPLRETEAWALADPSALCVALGIRQLPSGWMERVRLPEDIQQPKEVLKGLVGEVRRRRQSLQPLPQLGELVSIEALDRLPAFRTARSAFEAACSAALTRPSSARR